MALLTALATTLCGVQVAQADRPSILKLFKRGKATQNLSAGRMLQKEDGPFMILAATLVGQGSRERAEKLANDVSDALGQPTFIYNEKFDYTGRIDYDSRTSRATRYVNPYKYEGYAVLVGEYDTVTHPDISKDLEKIKRYQPKVFRDPSEMAAETDRSNPVTTVKNIATNLHKMAKKQGKDFGPMARAHVTRNPMLPAEYFSPPVVDSFVRKLNQDVEHSLLENPGAYTVVVKTFRATERIVDQKTSAKSIRPDGDHLALMMATANKMVMELRKKGVEAYQYHDRHQSLVTVGSFERLGTELPGGRFQYASGIRKTLTEYSALNVEPALAAQVPTRNQRHSDRNGVLPAIAANAVALVPFDVRPKPIAVPKVEKSSLYRALGRR